MAAPRLALFAAAVALMVLSWMHHVFLAFWLFGLPFLRWLRGGARETSLVVREHELELEAGHWLGDPLVLPRSAITRIEIGRAGFTRLRQRALLLRLKNQQVARLFVGLSAAQARFVSAGLERWLSAEF